jgi:hypothetical protein
MSLRDIIGISGIIHIMIISGSNDVWQIPFLSTIRVDIKRRYETVLFISQNRRIRQWVGNSILMVGKSVFVGGKILIN